MSAAKKKRTSGPSGPTTPHRERDGVRVDLYLPEALAKRVDAGAKRAGMNRTAYVRKCLEEAIP